MTIEDRGLIEGYLPIEAFSFRRFSEGAPGQIDEPLSEADTVKS